ncbi:MAG: glycosyltransferase family 4 protein [Candidatus Eisenbacteria bacterium]|uniref:Glycosyltransferase family 4 protein n=1 Tax=Eiseniibacteriota bacterium TaxID=2212470 RepID=A0A7Y2EAQ5_UNCEI|nr:glycosyltransferase family 4 protein [Candidatus Eisenbacteria bacterium]
MSKQPLRLAYLSIGRHIHTERWVCWFAAKGHKVDLLTVQPGPMPGVDVHDITSTLGPKPMRYALSLGKVKRILKELQPDLLHTHFLTGYGYWGHFSGWRPHMLTVWGDDVYVTPYENRLKKWLAERALRGADYVTGDSEDIVQACIGMGSHPKRSEVVQWGVDFEQFNAEVDTTQVRRRHGIPPHAPVILSTRSFTQDYYNIDVVVETAPLIQEKFPDAHYIIAGNEGDDTAFRQRAEEFGLTKNVHWVGRIDHKELPQYVAASTVFLTIPSVDATAVSLLEAMACETAIVATDLPSAAEWIFPHKTGLLVKPRDKDGLVAAIQEFLEQPELRSKVGKEACALVRQKADHNRNMERVESLYYDLVAGKTPAAV